MNQRKAAVCRVPATAGPPRSPIVDARRQVWTGALLGGTGRLIKLAIDGFFRADLRSKDGNVIRRRKAEPDHVGPDRHYRDADVVADDDFLANFAAEH